MRRKMRFKKIVFLLLVVYIGYGLISRIYVHYEKVKETSTAKEQLENLKIENQKLQDEINMSKTDKYLEIKARERLGLIKENEIPVIQVKK